MSSRDLCSKILGPVAHLPTWFFIIGYPIFWLQLYFLKVKEGVTSPLAWILFLIISLLVIIFQTNTFHSGFKKFQEFCLSLSKTEKLLVGAGCVLSIGILIIVSRASFLPIHLLQEFDCLQYHYTLPHQHLILGSFAHIPWAADDLFLLPVDFALTPFWYATTLPNKIPQFIILLGLLMVVERLIAVNRSMISLAVLFAILGSHGLGIQMGTGMLDITICYLFFAGLDSLKNGRWMFAAIELTFFFWSKPVMPFQVVCVLAVLILILGLLKFSKWQISSEFQFRNAKQTLIAYLILSTAVAGPFIIKSIHYAATPFFPLAVGVLGQGAQIQSNPVAWDSLQKANAIWMSITKDGYGHGRDLIAFIKHWLLLAIPEKGVNNAFDYPLGLPYLLLIGPFLWVFFKDFFSKKVSIFSLLVVVSWGLWWFGSQQTRFLYISLILIFIISLTQMIKVSKVLLSCLVIALVLHLISIWGAHRKDFFLMPQEVVRVEDRNLLAMGEVYYRNKLHGFQECDKHDAAYANFPVIVRKEALPHTVKF